MKEKGFTLIELLAVIVILAIIALIATPVILNIIDSSRDSANRESVNLYGKSVENAIAKKLVRNASYEINEGNYVVSSDGKMLTYGEEKIEVEYDGKIEELNGIMINITKNGSIYFSVTINGKIYNYPNKKSVCKLVNGDINKKVSTVQCGTEYFRIISTNNTTNGTVTMLAEKNIVLITSNPKQTSLYGGGGATSFSNSDFWLNYEGYEGGYEPPYKEEYLSNPERIYEESNLYKYVEAYENTLRNMGISGVSATLPTYEDIYNLGVRYDTVLDGYDVSWAMTTSYWTKTVNVRYVTVVTEVNSYHYGLTTVEYTEFANYGVRPVVTVPIDQIEY